MNHSKLTPEKAITIKPGVELDVFIFEYIFDGVIGEEHRQYAPAHQIPSFSKNPAANKILMIRMFAEIESLSMVTKFGQEFCDLARASGQIMTEKIVPVWVVESLGITAYGRTHEEALAKLVILFKMGGHLA